MASQRVLGRIEGRGYVYKRRVLPGFRITPANRQTIQGFLKHMRQKGNNKEGRANNDKTIAINLLAVGLFADGLPDFDEVTKEQVHDLHNRVEAMNLKHTTKNRYKHAVYLFLNWLGKESLAKEVPLDLSRPEKTRGEIPEPGEIQAMIDACTWSRDRAVIATLFESGFRIGELICCRVCDLVFQPEGYADLSIPKAEMLGTRTGRTKTGPYTAVIDYAGPYLRAWLEEHPNKGSAAFNKSALFTDSTGKPLEYHGFSKMLKRAAARAKMTKAIHPHILRHANATQLALRGWSAEEINLAQGRQQNSRIGNAYIHMLNADVRKKKLRERGYLKEEGPAGRPLLETKVCWKCGTNNPGSSLFCYVESCRAPLKGTERFEEVATALDMYRAIQRIHSDPELRNDLERLVMRKEQKDKG